jgi:hypothetical protein
MGYFAELMSTNEEVRESIRPLLRLCREHIDRSIRMNTVKADVDEVSISQTARQIA